MVSLQKEECVIKCFLPPPSEDVGHPTPLRPAEAWEPFGEVLPPEIGVSPHPERVGVFLPEDEEGKQQCGPEPLPCEPGQRASSP